MEFIGLALATLVFFAVATVIGCVFAVAAWLFLRNRECRRITLMLFAAGIPIASAAYLWLCVAILPGESLFGDISQPLPNGYSLQALGKMPDFATINKGYSLGEGAVPLSECIGSLAVSGPFVAGRYSHPFRAFDPKPDEGYFIFDTHTGQFVDLKTLPELEKRLGHPIEMVAPEYFRSSELSYKRQQAINDVVMFAPPVIAIVGYILWIFKLPRARPE